MKLLLFFLVLAFVIEISSLSINAIREELLAFLKRFVDISCNMRESVRVSGQCDGHFGHLTNAVNNL